MFLVLKNLVLVLYSWSWLSVTDFAVVHLVTPPPVEGQGIVFGRFISFFVSLSAILRENGWTDLHEIFREGVE